MRATARPMNTATFSEAFGRLGNQLFQLGLLFAIRERRGHEFYLPHAGESLWVCFDVDVPSAGPECRREFCEVNGTGNYDARVFEQPDGTSFHGFFQSYRYLESCRDDLVRFLRFNSDQRAWSQALLFAYRRRHSRPLVSLHVRRGDYVWPGWEDIWGNLAADGYYDRAVAALGDDVTYLVFSDDIAWCRESLELDRAEFVDVDQGTSLAVMAGCDVNVVANSSFSWWGAYLNPASDVYAPSRWFGPAMTPPNDRQDDIVLPTWRTIPVFGDVLPASPSLDRTPRA
jgi:Glycosyl transferase family 11